MALLPIDPDALVQLALDPSTHCPWTGAVGRDVLVVDLDRAAGAEPDISRWRAPGPDLTAVVVGTTTRPEATRHPLVELCDVALAPDDPVLAAVAATVADNPIAATSLAVLLRGAGHRSVDEGLAVESAVYSTLQAGPEFATWRASRPVRRREPQGPPVRLERRGPELHITLDRPEVRNAFDAALRDGLFDALAVARLDHTVEVVHLRGAGPAFCSGGDLDEFGRFPDPATAHLVRLQRSIGRAIHGLGSRVVAHLHGACAGSGVELAAFACRVVARRSTVLSLPEVGLGLVPGAGGTVSLPRRIGRHATARLALSGEAIDAGTARAWGLVDELID